MANEEHLARLKQGVEAWNRWRKTNRRIQPDLAEADLSCEDLAEIDLSQAELTKADLSGADLRRASLTAAHLRRADLSRAQLAKAYLSQADLREADLAGAHLHGARLGGAHLSMAYLREADLRGADLRGAHLRVADLYKADLREATLIEADLRGVYFCEVDLRGADLHEANLLGTDLEGADLSGSQFGRTILSDVDLSSVRGLETVQHKGPSIIGIDTLSRSQGNIPEVFLRGAGVPEEFITYIKSLVGGPFEFYSCFISYSHTDQSFARHLHDQLQACGIRCWLDEHQLLPGDDIYEQIDRGIRFWDKVLLCCSQASLTSWWVDNEINKAFEGTTAHAGARWKGAGAHSPQPRRLSLQVDEREGGGGQVPTRR